MKAAKNLAECAEAVGASQARFEEYEFGMKSPSLPELEALTNFLNMPLDSLWQEKIVSSIDSQKSKLDIQRKIGLRQRIIGAMLRKLRMDAGISLETMADESGLPTELLTAYELGEMPIPLPHLELFGKLLDHPINEFQESTATKTQKAFNQGASNEFLALPQELQTFISKPINRPYLELAQHLSELPTEKLRAIAEGILAITL
jgi:transcriptional regulator with XRE-family HTH domain